MSAYYFDSSALVKRYAQEIGTGWVTLITAPGTGHTVLIAMVTGAEVAAAISRKVQEGAIASADGRQAMGAFRHHFNSQYVVSLITKSMMDRAMDMAEKHRLRGYDAVQLGVALELHTLRIRAGLPALIFVAGDNNLLSAAQSEGLVTENPNHHSQSSPSS